jgi:tetratricopeptide (TPR) repeat protein
MPWWHEDLYYDMHSIHKFYINILNEIVIKQKCIRQLHNLINIESDEMAMNDLINDNKKFIRLTTDRIKKECDAKQIIKLREVSDLVKVNKFENALVLLKELENSKEKQIVVRAKIMLGDLLFNQGEFDLASQVYEEVIKKYDYLKKYINYERTSPYDNTFYSVQQNKISDAEKRLGFKFPLSLKEFWQEIGYGFFRYSSNGKKTMDHTNRLMTPSQIADIILLKEDSGLILPEAVEYFDDGYIGDGDILFFEIGDLSSFLVMKPKSSKPNSVYNMIGEVIEEEFEKFIWRLYYESPTYYVNVNK